MSRGTILVDPYPRTLDQIFDGATRARLDGLGEVVWHDGPPLADRTVGGLLADLVAIIGQTALPAERLARAPNLRAVLNVEGNFLPNVDYGACAARGVDVRCCAPVFAQPVAELALGLALAAAREIPLADADVRAGREELFGGENPGAFLLARKTLGLVGCGNLARALLPLLRPFAGPLLGYDPWLDAAALGALGIEPVSLDELLRRSRVVFVLAPPTIENTGMIGPSELDLLPPGAVVVLVSRAPVVDWDAALDAAARGAIRFAADVFPEEPIPPDERARTTTNTILSAHRAGNVPEIWREIGVMVADDLEAILTGTPPTRMQPADPATVERLRSRPVG